VHIRVFFFPWEGYYSFSLLTLSLAVNITLHTNQMVSVYGQSMSAYSVANWLLFFFFALWP